MRAFLIIFLSIWSFSSNCWGQTGTSTLSSQTRSCATTAYQEALQAQDPSLLLRQNQVRQQAERLTGSLSQRKDSRKSTITIPVVFHVVYNTEAENIPDEQILSQLAILNADFRRQNPDTVDTPSYFKPFAADTDIEFCLASIDPNGDLTTGITRTRTDKKSFDTYRDDVKFTSRGGTDIWDSSQYLNIWICNITGNTLGYSSFPGFSPAIDGVVLLYSSIGAPPYNRSAGPYNQGRTATHEVGHWLGLRHIWGGNCNNADGIADTPNQQRDTGGCPNEIIVSCDNGPYGNMWQNYMDYTDDGCMNLFTKGQAELMQSTLATSRASILTSLACTGAIRSDFEVSNPSDTLILAGSSIMFLEKSSGSRAVSWLWEFEGGTPATSTQENPTVTYNTPGVYRVRLTVANGTVSDTKERTDYIQVTVPNLVVYPNPATDYITIEQPARIEVRHIQLMNSVGQTVLQQEVKDRVVLLQVQHLPAGIYYLRLQSSNGLVIKKVSVVR
ncbi:M43 family zinc metalloprotease [Pontibacter sp. 13R65]|uniref:M43 family zinc metalloprotease n=1 Tax=Pontibacter sp. 13R65 TaxID=3127458 RepID=UPI00301D9AB9